MQHSRRQFCRKCLQWSLAAPGFFYLANQLKKDQATAATAPHYILTIHCDGGWDPFMVFDNKLGNANFELETNLTETTSGSGLVYLSNSSRPAVTAFFANNASKSCIVNGIYCQGLGHDEALPFACAIKQPDSQRFVDWQSYFAHKLADDKPFPHVVVAAPFIPGHLSSYSTLLNAALIAETRAGILPSSTQFSDDEELALRHYLDWAYTESLSKQPEESLRYEKLASLASNLKKEPEIETFLQELSYDATEEALVRYGKLAVELFSQDLAQCVSLQMGARREWDSHSDHFNKQNGLFEKLFVGLQTIIDEITATGLQDKVTILVKSELGRAPKLNSKQGKDHWPYTSALLWGAGIKGQMIFGETDEWGRGRAINPLFGSFTGEDLAPLTLNHIYAAIYQLNGIALENILPDVLPASAVLVGPS